MIGTQIVEELVQSVALSHNIKGHPRCSLLLLAAPESGKTTITTAAHCKHVHRIAVISALSVLKELENKPHVEYFLFNDMSVVRALSHQASTMLVGVLNQLTQDERGVVAFAGKEAQYITRPIGIIGCMPFKTFTDHRSRWRELGFVSRMLPFCYKYSKELVAEIKDTIDHGNARTTARRPVRKMPHAFKRPIEVTMNAKFTRELRHIADARAEQLGEIGIRLLQNYHTLIRAHALSFGRTDVAAADMQFLRTVNRFMSIEEPAVLQSVASQSERTPR